MKMDHKLDVDFNLVQQIKEVRQYWNQDTALARKKRKEFRENVMRIGGTVLVIYLVGYLNGIKRGVNYGNVNLTLNSNKER